MSNRVAKVQVKQVRMPMRKCTWEEEETSAHSFIFFLSTEIPYNAQKVAG